jgi:hypothetical protein
VVYDEQDNYTNGNLDSIDLYFVSCTCPAASGSSSSENGSSSSSASTDGQNPMYGGWWWWGGIYLVAGDGQSNENPKDPCVEIRKLINNRSLTLNSLRTLLDTKMNGTTTNPKTESGTTLRVTDATFRDYSKSPTPTLGQPQNNGGRWTMQGTSSDNFKWNPDSGYYAGTDHDHPDDRAPNPADVIVPLVYPLFQSGEVKTATTNDQTTKGLYVSNVMSVINTPDHTFFVTINNLQTLLDKANLDTVNPGTNQTTYDQYLDEYHDHDSPTSPNLMLATSYALKMTFGDAINLYVAPRGQTMPSFKAISASDAGGNPITSEIICPL